MTCAHRYIPEFKYIINFLDGVYTNYHNYLSIILIFAQNHLISLDQYNKTRNQYFT